MELERMLIFTEFGTEMPISGTTKALIKTNACGVHMTVGDTSAKGDLVRTTPGHVSTTEATS